MLPAKAVSILGFFNFPCNRCLHVYLPYLLSHLAKRSVILKDLAVYVAFTCTDNVVMGISFTCASLMKWRTATPASGCGLLWPSEELVLALHEILETVISPMGNHCFTCKFTSCSSITTLCCTCNGQVLPGILLE